MTDLRALIREVLTEEIATLRAEILGGVQVERVRVACAADLTEFAQSILRRAQEPGFVADLQAGRLRFEPEGTPASVTTFPRASVQPAAQPAVIVTTVPAQTPELRKGLITERDIAAIGDSETRLRILKSARLTPLASDEARRRGIRIERTLA